ncbi:MAG: alpha-L-rhamnosidase [Chloroflexi bacterium]|nr:MAG: alpha-L-rhamnosidase [Chloroflexota bacterium]
MPITPTRLRCEYLTDPLGIDEAQPRLSWVLESADRGQRQIAYQVIVASSAELLDADGGDLWESGKVPSDQSIHIVYAGAALQSRRRCWWKVRVWDREGRPSAYSQPGWWEMGLLHTDEWLGGWVGPGIEAEEDLPPSPYLRTIVRLTKPMRAARLYSTARGLYEIYINGNRVGNALLAPGWTDYQARIEYQTHDVTGSLHEGENVLGVILGTGWYAGHVGFGGSSRHYGSRPEALLQLHVEYTDGTAQTVVTDGTWKSTTGPIRFSDLLMGETYDARRTLTGWNAPCFDDTDWQPVRVRDRGDTQIVAASVPPARVTEEIVPISVTEPASGTFIFDLGQNIAGWVRLRVQGDAGTKIRLRFAEMLNPDGTLYTDNLRTAMQTDTYILHGEGEETWEPRFTFHGFRYAEIIGFPGVPTVDMITGCVVHSDTPPTGTFTCSNPMVSQLQRNIVWGQRGNFLSVPTDCPQRDERLGWLGDAQIFIRTACFNMDVATFFTKWMRDVEDGQSGAGAFPDVAPRLVNLTDGAPAWGDAGVIVPWTIWQCYGDTRIVARHWEAMTRWMTYLARGNLGYLRNGQLNNNFGDWLALDGGAMRHPGASATPKDLLATAYWAYDARLMAEMARVLDRHDEARQYDALFEKIKEAFITTYVSADGTVRGETQTGYVLALYMNLLPADLRAAATDRLVADIERRGWHLSTGFVGVGYLCPALTVVGRPDVAYRLLESDTFPSWGYTIRHGATTIWERWDGWTEEHGFQDPGMNSFNHYALGSVGEWLYRTVAGIDTDPAAPGYRRILIHPHPGGSFQSAEATYDSVRGRITTAWRRDGDTFTLDVTIPANTTAIVHVLSGATDGAAIREGATLAREAEGVAFLRMEKGEAIFTVGSGTYTFVSVFPFV